MSESSFSKGLNAGCGVLAALFFAFVVLPMGSCLALSMCASVSSGPRGQPSPPSVDHRVRDSGTPDEQTTTDCGTAPGTEGMTCRSQEEAGAMWDTCLSRVMYTSVPARGCPGAERCCQHE